MPPPAILLITGDPDVERTVVNAAGKTGHALNTARTAYDALRLFSNGFEESCLIFVDLDPQVHGITLFNALDDCHGSVPLVVLTDCEEACMKPPAEQRGAAVCLGKPVTVSQFTRLMDQLCPTPAH
jgi:DNA-binding NtrC family response regulator